MKRNTQVNIDRAMFLLEHKFHTPTDMYHFWRMTGSARLVGPEQEKVFPWWKELPIQL